MRLIATVFSICVLLIPYAGWGQERSVDKPLRGWTDFYAQRITQYEIVSAEDHEAKLELRREPLLMYTNPVRGRDQHGAVFAWTRDGRPEVLGTVWSVAGTNNQGVRRTAHEVHSLASFPLRVTCPAATDPQATRASELAWNLEPEQGSFLLSNDAARDPAESEPLRLVQIRAIAKQFSAVSIDRQDDRERPLRLMPTPLMRYQSPAAGVTDGCLFAFVLATDPELLVVIEALDQPAEKGQGRWRVSPARFTGTALRLRHGDQQVWSCDRIDYKNQSGPYRLQIGVSELPATISSEVVEAGGSG